ncbi:MAG: hypothetical protein AB7G12_17190 [Thermoanaerobaculia bacterium]
MSPRRQRLLAATLSTLFSVVLLDVVLRLFPELPGQRLANIVWSRYGGFSGGIYAVEPQSHIEFMRPGFRTVNYWNGYHWHHATDGLGFRNPEGTPHGVLLLGDSLIYGHGVEEEETVAHFLRSEYGIPAYNMGRQGACLLDEYVFLRTYLDELQPSDVVLFVFLNDFHDLEVYRTTDQIERIPELDYDYRAVREWARRLGERPKRRLKRWFSTLPSIRLLRALGRDALSNLSFVSPAWAEESEPLPEFLEIFANEEELAKVARYYEHIFADLIPRLTARGIRTHVVYLSAGAGRRRWAAVQRQAIALVERAASPFGLEMADTRSLFAECSDCFLPDDGHYTRTGHQLLAEFLATRVLRGEGSDDPAIEARAPSAAKNDGAAPPDSGERRAARKHRPRKHRPPESSGTG